MGIKVRVFFFLNNNNRTDLFRLICYCNFIFRLLRILFWPFSCVIWIFFVLFGLFCIIWLFVVCTPINAVILDCLGYLL
jgi:hypothetical protein